MKDRRWLFWSFMIGMLILDQLTKHWARTAFNEHQQPGFPFPGFLEFTLIYNQGIAFGLMKGSGILMTPIAVGIAGAALVYSSKNPGDPYVVKLLFWLIRLMKNPFLKNCFY